MKRFYALDYTEQDFSDNLNSPAIQEAQLNQTTRNTKGLKSDSSFPKKSPLKIGIYKRAFKLKLRHYWEY